VLRNITQGAVGEQFSGVFEQEHKLLASEIRALVHKRTPAVVVELEVIKLKGALEIG
jgi:hypothetical protein